MSNLSERRKLHDCELCLSMYCARPTVAASAPSDVQQNVKGKTPIARAGI